MLGCPFSLCQINVKLMSSAQLISYVFVEVVSYCFYMFYIVTIQKPKFLEKHLRNEI